jgi:hypothetical protein
VDTIFYTFLPSFKRLTKKKLTLITFFSRTSESCSYLYNVYERKHDLVYEGNRTQNPCTWSQSANNTYPKNTPCPNPSQETHDQDTGPRDRVTTEKQQLQKTLAPGWHTSTYSPPVAPGRLAREQYDMTRPEDSIIQARLALVYIAPKMPTLQVAANLDFDNLHGTARATRTAPPWRGRRKSDAIAWTNLSRVTPVAQEGRD